MDDLPRTRKGTAVLFSCRSGERAFEAEKLKHGVFFYHVIAGLKGEAKDKRGEVTWASLVEHVAEKVTEDVPALIGGGAKQTPHEIKNLEGRSPLLLAVKKLDEAERLFREGMASINGLKEIDFKRAMMLLRQAAARGHALAEGYVGLLVFSGNGVKEDKEEGKKLITKVIPAVRKNAETGIVDAQVLLGLCYQYGLSGDKDYKEAVRWYRAAAEKDDGPAMAYLGFMYDWGLGVKEDEKEATRWYYKAAEKGFPYGMTLLGFAYDRGRGVDKDEKKAVQWFTKAADKGFPFAMYQLGLKYTRGEGVEKDNKKAAELLIKAANRLHGDSYSHLGYMYEKGQGVKMDRAEALKWYRKAAEIGNEAARKKVKELEGTK